MKTVSHRSVSGSFYRFHVDVLNAEILLPKISINVS